MEELEKIKQKLYERFPGDDCKKLIDSSFVYIEKKIVEKDKDGKTKYSFSPVFLLQSVTECIENDFALDGINYVISGNAMYMPTYKAFKNKIYMVYPESKIDVQLIREGDEYSFSKENGVVTYTHTIADPFAETTPVIKGAYCIIKNNRGEFLETLNRRDYEEMKKSSKSPYLWVQWESEFWKKSVIKRACKTHFNDITAAIEQKDNEVIGLDDIVKASPSKKQAIIEAHTNGDSNTGNQTE